MTRRRTSGRAASKAFYASGDYQLGPGAGFTGPSPSTGARDRRATFTDTKGVPLGKPLTFWAVRSSAQFPQPSLRPGNVVRWEAKEHQPELLFGMQIPSIGPHMAAPRFF